MAAQKVVPTMSIDGWVVGVKQRIDRLFAYWLANQKSQSYVSRASIVSFQWDIQQYNNSPEELATVSARNLENYLSNHFDAATVTSTIKYPGGERSGSFFHLEFDVKVREKDIGYDVGRTLIEIKDGIFRRIIEGQ